MRHDGKPVPSAPPHRHDREPSARRRRGGRRLRRRTAGTSPRADPRRRRHGSSRTCPTPARSSRPPWSPAARVRDPELAAETTQVGDALRDILDRDGRRRRRSTDERPDRHRRSGDHRASTSTCTTQRARPRPSRRCARSPPAPRACAASPTSAATRPTGSPRSSPRSTASAATPRRPTTASIIRPARSARRRRSAPTPTTAWRTAGAILGLAVAGRGGRGHRDHRQDLARTSRNSGTAMLAQGPPQIGHRRWHAARFLGRVRRPDPPQQEGLPAPHQGPAQLRRRRHRTHRHRRPRPLHLPSSARRTADERKIIAARARSWAARPVVVGDLVSPGRRRHPASPDTLARIVEIEERQHAAAPQRRRHGPGRAGDRGQRRPAGDRGRAPPTPSRGPASSTGPWSPRTTPASSRCCCVTKADVKDPAELLSNYRHLDFPVIISKTADSAASGIDARSDDGLSARLDKDAVAQLRGYLDGKVTVMLGHSGVGKSTMVNALTGAERATGGVNAVTGRGRHTSSSALALKSTMPRPAAGSSTPRASAPSAWPTWTRTGSSAPSPTWNRAPTIANAAASTTPPPSTAASTPGLRPGTRDPPDRHGWRPCAGCWAPTRGWKRRKRRNWAPCRRRCRSPGPRRSAAASRRAARFDGSLEP